MADGSRAGAGSPILVDLAGERHVVLLTSWNLRGVALATGKTLWAVKLEGSEENSTPLVYKDLIVYADYKDRPRAIRLVKGDKGITPQEVWKGNGPTPYMSTPVLEGDLLFGSSSRGRGSFFCLDARNGQTLWESAEENGSGYATILNAGKVMLFLTVNGRLVVVKATGKEYAPIADYKVAVTQTWAHPVFLGKRILIRDQTTLRSLAITDDPN